MTPRIEGSIMPREGAISGSVRPAVTINRDAKEFPMGPAFVAGPTPCTGPCRPPQPGKCTQRCRVDVLKEGK